MPAYKLIEFKDITQVDTNCSICLESFSIENDQQNDMHVCITSCKHYFHKMCIDAWLQRAEECPLCKTSFGDRRQRPEDNFDIGEFLNNEQNINPLGQENDCIICLQPLGSERFNILCGNDHDIFHRQCAQTWLENSPNCPICRGRSRLNGRNVRRRVRVFNPPQPAYVVQLNPISPNRGNLFQTAIDRTHPRRSVTLEALQTAIEDATTSYLTWRGDGRGVYHRGNTGKDRALNFYLQITRSSTHNNNVVACWNYICNTIRNYPRHNHSYTSFILNSLKTINGLRLRAIDYTSSDNEIRNERRRLLDRGLSEINISETTPRKFKALIFGTSESARLFWQICFNEQPNDLSTMGIGYKKLNSLQGGDTLQVWVTAGQERFISIPRNAYKGANIIFVVGDAGEVRDFASRIRDNNSIPVIWVELSN
ncbi:RING finger domain-containing protein [Fangia hongkongensis]|uniref:RING finger domain-containing protein n=1 Tax=Fangia hongkongensis TaxID=270495 RepID=UPI00037C097E|nr:RING finger domain-containing protein [Fangia hongkongensis]MBK2125127.1 hypothetical protein [Fangia hongkongensis]